MYLPPVVRPAVLAGLGAGGSLAAASLCILALGAATFGYVKWPDQDSRTPSQSVTLRAPAAEQLKPVPPRVAAAPQSRAAAPPVTRRAPAPAAEAPRRRSRAKPELRASPRPAPERPATTRTAPPAAVPAVVEPPATPAETGPDPTIAVGEPVERILDLGRKTGRQVGSVAGEVSSPAGELVDDVSGTASAVDGIADLLP